MKKILTAVLVLTMTLTGCKNTITMTKIVYNSYKSAKQVIEQKIDSTYQIKHLHPTSDSIQVQQPAPLP